MRRRNRPNEKRGGGKRQRLSAEDRAQFARERQAVCGKLLTQHGFEGALVVEHIRGSQYLLRLANGTEVFASHKKQKGQGAGALSQAGWQLWEERQ
jgi:hypothetical protein